MKYLNDLSEKFYIYGAGVFAYQTALAIWNLTQKYPSAYIVSEQDEKKDINGIPVIEVKKLDKSERKTKVIVATPEVYHTDIFKLLTRLEFTNVYFLSMPEENQLMGNYLKNILGLNIFIKTDMTKDFLLQNSRSNEEKVKEVLSVYMACSRKDKVLKDNYYLPDYIQKVWAGSGKINEKVRLSDDKGENISYKNGDYCELTVTYWVWKNCRDDYKGICHYRRVFDVSEREMEEILSEDTEMIVPYPYICFPNAKEQMKRYVNEKDLKVLAETIAQVCPEYSGKFEEMCEQKLFYNYNMLIAKRNIFDDYAKYMFKVLEVAEKRCLNNGQLRNDRYAGYMGEILTSLYIYANRKCYKVVHAPWRWLK